MKLSSLLRGLSAPLLCLTLVTLTTAQSLTDGLKIETTKPVACERKTKNGDTLNMHYRGTLQSDGSEFDSSYSRNQPFQFTIGKGQVIKGWDEGLLDMCAGEGRRLTIPPALAYKDRDMGKIPPNSVLVFETELLSIEGIDLENSEPSLPNPVPVSPPSPDSDNKYSNDPHGINTGQEHTEDSKGSASGPHKSKKGKGECKLLGRFAILIQGALGALALLALVWKRWREKPRRPVKIWFFDVSKQVVGSFLLHFANLFLSMLSSGGLKIDSSDIGSYKGEEHKHPNPCSFYLLNLAIDTTIGIPILVLFLRILHFLFLRTPLANPPESLKSGNYGHPPKWRWWGKQALVYFLGLFGMKLFVFLLFQIFPWLGWVGDWALRWTEGKEWMQITFVMLVFPLIMNAAQYWIIDSFIKDKVGEYSSVNDERRDSEDGSENEGLIGGRGRDSEDEGSRPVRRISPRGGRVVAEGEARTKEANPLPLPVEFESDDEEQHSSRKQHSRQHSD